MREDMRDSKALGVGGNLFKFAQEFFRVFNQSGHMEKRPSEAFGRNRLPHPKRGDRRRADPAV